MPGYKLSDAGVIPNSWSVKTIGEITTCIAGGTPSTKVSTYWGGSIPWMSSGELNLKYVHDVLGRITQEGLTNSSTKLIPENCVLVGLAGQGKTRGTAAINLIPLCTNQSIAAILPSESFISAYLYFNLDSRYHELRNLSSGGGGRGALNLKIIKAIPVPLPSLEEQRNIAQTLTDLDKLLFSLDEIIEKKRDMKQAVMQQLLTCRTRLPGFSGEWTSKRLDEIAEIRSGGTPSTSQPSFWDGDIQWCTPTDITGLNGYKYLRETSRKISQAGLNESSAEMIPAQSVLMTSRATIGECAINAVPMATNQGFKNFVPYNITDVNFLYYLLGNQKQGLIALCSGSTFLEIGKTQLAAYEVLLPSTKVEQSAIAEVLSEMDEELALLEARHNKTLDLKRAIMQELLTGKTCLFNKDRNNA